MHELRFSLAVFLVLNLVVGLARVGRLPTLGDRVLVAQLYGTTVVAVLLLLAAEPQASSLHDVAMIFALFASLTVIALVRSAGIGPGSER